MLSIAERKPPFDPHIVSVQILPQLVRKREQQMTSDAKRAREVVLHSRDIPQSTREIIKSHSLYPTEIGLLALIGKYIQPLLSKLPNQNAISIGCFHFEESIPWVLLTSGIIHGIDQTDNTTMIGQSLKDALESGLITPTQEKRIGYGFNHEGNARKERSYKTNKYGQFGVALLRHPDVFNIHAYSGNSEKTYVEINNLTINNALAVKGIGLITTYRKEEMDIYKALLKPYVDAGIIKFGFNDENGRVLVYPQGSRNVDNPGELGSDNYILGFTKLRHKRLWESRRINKKALQAYREALEKYKVDYTNTFFNE